MPVSGVDKQQDTSMAVISDLTLAAEPDGTIAKSGALATLGATLDATFLEGLPTQADVTGVDSWESCVGSNVQLWVLHPSAEGAGHICGCSDYHVGKPMWESEHARYSNLTCTFVECPEVSPNLNIADLIEFTKFSSFF